MRSYPMRNFFITRIIIPAILVILLYVVSFMVIFLPMVERGFMDRKKEMIMELTNSTWSVVDEFHREALRGSLTEETAKQMAINKVEAIRYGEEAKDYFWITDMVPVMVMHPYRQDLNGLDVSDYTDPQGTRLFVEAIRAVQDGGDGYIDYWWQWKDDSTRIVPKLSYVKEFEPWGWIIGTGIYLEDVKEEIKVIRGRLIRITLLFLIVVSFIVLYIMRQSLKIEHRRRDVEEKLKQSHQKYKKLVDASTESTMMWLNDRLAYYNQPMLELTGYTRMEMMDKSMDELVEIPGESLGEIIKNLEQTRNFEALLLARSGQKIDIVLTISAIVIDNQRGFIFIIKEVSRHLIRDKSAEMLQEELRTSLLMMNTPLKSYVRRAEYVDMEHSLQQVASLMLARQTDLLLVTKGRNDLVGILHKDQFALQATAGQSESDARAFHFMRSPVTYMDDHRLLFEALFQMEQQSVDYLVVRDSKKRVIGYVVRNDLLEAQQNASLLLVKKIEKAQLLSQLQSLYDKLPGILYVLLSTDSNCRNIAQISTAISDAIEKRVVELCIDMLGEPPGPFAFVALGSDGREEQTLKTDQDNAIIFGDEVADAGREYFLELAAMVNQWLHDIGYEFCKGKVMARNPEWCQPLSQWKTYFQEWVSNSDPESILDTSIFFDIRHVYGDRAMVDELRRDIFHHTESNNVFFSNLALSVNRNKAVTYSEKQEGIDLKRAMMPVVGFARLYSLKNRINETNTVYRLRQVMNAGNINKEFVREIIKAYEFLMFLRYRHQTASILQNKNPDNIIKTDSLTNIEKAALKTALSDVAGLYVQLGLDYDSI